ncbi:MAG: XRE family transcriptional regulator, partial [Clostridia bacterium]|nr:XRE family transcriptional regulator [Clostridia bacterium]
MSYFLKLYDDELLKFDFETTVDSFKTNILWINNEKENLLPLGMTAENESLKRWIKSRTIPSNRAYVQNFLAKLGLNEKDTKGIIDICRGLSLNDCYWIVDENFSGKFSSFNLYENHFSRTLSYIAFTGYGSSIKSTFRSSPEFTTNGMLAKCWKREKGKILLYKSGTEGFANSGNEPYAEFYAYQVANRMGINAVKYNLSKYDGRLCSTCELFTNKDISFVPVSRIVTDGGINAVIEYYKNLGEKYFSKLIDMLVFDAVVCNTDRHFGNFGFLVDNHSNKIVDVAPIFDNGLSLCSFAMDDDFENIEAYANTRTPAAYNDFVGFLKP